ncbi:DUF3592 domain-containing protein [Gemmatimonas groenlandica]|uniref:DUF3592 domain-containing protein n=1 Tax=Gemmatimonas groenlandica TaxID=2732249 RepID=A0A6M4IVA9_9BACT|nr:DUF3592 domain-containing protein [Gemmatimonas groenlandica]QJR37537.1 DUF3592 domain-containing protein [Gemmatimonas groenlandica]
MARAITMLIFGGFGVMFLYVGLTQFLQQRRSLANAVEIVATIAYSAVHTSTSADTDGRLISSNSTTTHRPDLRFTYVVAGKAYESDLLYPTIIVRGYASREAVEEVLAPYPVNATVPAYVDPSHPGEAFLIAERSSAPIVFLVLALLVPLVAWFVSKYI